MVSRLNNCPLISLPFITDAAQKAHEATLASFTGTLLKKHGLPSSKPHMTQKKMEIIKKTLGRGRAGKMNK